MNNVVFEILVGIAAAVLVFILRSGSTRLKYGVASFGGKKPAEPIPDEIRDALARQYMHQQAVAFGLVVAAIILGLLLSSSLVFRVIFAKTLSLEDVGRAAVLAGDLFLGRYAFRSYREASTRAERLIIPHVAR
jgi:hypothetical protein